MSREQVALRSALSNLDLRARRIVDGIRTGGHSSVRAGAAVEFDRHQAYQPGDDLRHLDWRVFARSERLVLKRARMDTALDVMMMLDASGSMLFESGGEWGSKHDLGSAVLQALAWVATEAGDRVAACHCGSTAVTPSTLRSGAPGLSAVMEMLQQSARQGESLDIETASISLVNTTQRPGLVMLCSDLLDAVSGFQQAMGRLRHAGHDVLVLQVLDHAEQVFDVPDEVRLENMEGTGGRRLSAGSVREDYLDALHAHQEQILQTCRGLHVDHILLDPHVSPVPALRSVMQHRTRPSGASTRAG